MAIVTKTLEESRGTTKVEFQADSGTFLVKTDGGFQLNEASEKVRVAGKKHDEKIGAEGRDEWTVEVIH